jgi:hypothetical protein
MLYAMLSVDSYDNCGKGYNSGKRRREGTAGTTKLVTSGQGVIVRHFYTRRSSKHILNPVFLRALTYVCHGQGEYWPARRPLN